MRKFIDVTGKTEDEAIKNALAQLGMDRDDVSVEVLERAKSGFLGIGSCPAKIRVSYGPDEEETIPAVTVEKRVEKPAPALRTTDKKKKEKSPVPAAAPAAPVVPDASVSGGDEDRTQEIQKFLTGLLAHMGSNATIEISLIEKGRYRVVLQGQNLGALIGRRGETLDAIQQLTNYAVNRTGNRVRIQLDAEGYREKREQSLQHLATKVASKVIKYRRSVTLEPMNAYERHVIHTALQNVEGVTTYSTGVDPNRRVIVALDREKRS